MQLIDTHCHLNFNVFDSDFLEVAKKSFDKGVDKVIIVGSDSITSKKALDTAVQINDFLSKKWAYAAVGIHPIHFDDLENFKMIEDLAKNDLTVAIGETGFDLFRIDEEKIPLQKKLFYKHLNLSRKVSKPLILHNRQSDHIFRQEFDQLKEARGVFHCFSSDYHFAKEAIDLGFYISFTGNITYGNKKLKKVIKKAPIERIMVETDAPYMVPEPLRSQGINRCEPYMALEVINKIAKEKELAVFKVSSQTTENALEFFGL